MVIGNQNGKISGGLLMYVRKRDSIEVFLGHPGGPFFKNKDEGAWDIPKGEVNGEEDKLKAAIREFEEETGINVEAHKEKFFDLGEFKRKDGKLIHIWAFENGDLEEFNPQSIVRLEWPPKSGKTIEFQEIDKFEPFTLDVAEKKGNTSTKEFVRRLRKLLNPQF